MRESSEDYSPMKVQYLRLTLIQRSASLSQEVWRAMSFYGDSSKHIHFGNTYRVEQRSNIKSLDKLKTFPPLAKHLDPQQAVMNPDFNVQSVCLGYNRIIIGTRSGTIYETPIAEE